MDRPGAPATPPAAQGDLHAYPLPRLLFHLLRKVFTGILALERPEGGSAQVFFRDGLPCYADLPSFDDVLGRVLLERGWIDNQQYNESLQKLSLGGKLHGQILREMGAIDEAQLVEGLRLQLRRKINRLFYYGPTTRFALYAQQHPYGHHAEAAHVRVDPLFVIYQGVRNAFSPQQLAGELIKLQGMYVQLHPHFDQVRARFGLKEEEEILLAVLAAGAVPHERIYRISNLAPTETQMLLYTLLVSEMLVLQPNPHGEQAAVPAAHAAPAQGAPAALATPPAPAAYAAPAARPVVTPAAPQPTRAHAPEHAPLAEEDDARLDATAQQSPDEPNDGLGEAWGEMDPEDLVDEPETAAPSGTMDGLPSIGALVAHFTKEAETETETDDWGTEAKDQAFASQGYEADDFDAEGFDAEGFDAEGFDAEGFDREGFDREGFDREGFDREGFDLEGYDREGYPAEGFVTEGYGRESAAEPRAAGAGTDDVDGPLTIDLGDDADDAALDTTGPPAWRTPSRPAARLAGPAGPAAVITPPPPAVITPPPPDDLGSTGPRPLMPRRSSPGIVITPPPPDDLRSTGPRPLQGQRSSPGPMITPPPPGPMITPPPPGPMITPPPPEAGAPIVPRRSSPGVVLTPPPPLAMITPPPPQQPAIIAPPSPGGDLPGMPSAPAPAFTPPPPAGTPAFAPPPPAGTPAFAPPPPAGTPAFAPPPTGTPAFAPPPLAATRAFAPPPTDIPAFALPPPAGPPGAPQPFGQPATQAANRAAASRVAAAANLSPQKAREAEQHRQLILGAFESTAEADFFTILGLDNKASAALIKEAYFNLAKQYHPDKIAGLGLQDVAEQAAEVFRRINEAHITLSDPAQRKEYEERLDRGTTNEEEQRQVREALEAEFAFQKGTVFFRKKDYRSALNEFKQAFKLAPEEGEHLAWVAWTVFCDPKTDRERMLPKLKQQFLEAVRISPTSAASHYFLGSIYLEMKEEGRATTCFKKALELQPNHIEAQRQLRVIQMRRERDKGDKKGLFGGDLFSRFKKK